MNLIKNLKYVYNKKGQIELLFDNIFELFTTFPINRDEFCAKDKNASKTSGCPWHVFYFRRKDDN